VFGSWRACATLVCFLGFIPATVPAAEADVSRPPAGSLIRDASFAQMLGRTLFWDTVQAMAPSGTDSGASPADITELTQILLIRHSLDRYRWLIERAFDESLWKGSDDSLMQANFALIWQLSTRLYAATLPADRKSVV